MPTGNRAILVLGLAGVLCFVSASANPAAAQTKSEDVVLPSPTEDSSSQDAVSEALSAAKKALPLPA